MSLIFWTNGIKNIVYLGTQGTWRFRRYSKHCGTQSIWAVQALKEHLGTQALETLEEL